MKAKEFWNLLSGELDYRFFSGVACPGLLPLHKAMSREFMHYIPAANERIALGMAYGACTAGFKSGLLLDMLFIEDLYTMLPFAINNGVPLIIIGAVEGSEKYEFDLPVEILKDNSSIRKLVKSIEKELVPGILFVGKDVIK